MSDQIKPTYPKRGHALTIIVLGSLTAFAPLSIDMYLPALPTLESVFHANTSNVQFTLSTFFLGFALGQAFYGPIADRFGRKPPLYTSLLLFAATSAACAVAPNIHVLAGLRFFQAIGACAGGVIARAMVRDLFPIEEMRRVFSLLMLVMGVAPLVAPLLGGYMLVWFGWASIFWLLAILAVICLTLVHFTLPETHPKERFQPLHLGTIMKGYGRLCIEPSFIGYAAIGAISMAAMFAYVAGSPFVFIKLYHVSEHNFGWIFGLNAFGLIGSAQINGHLLYGADPARIVRNAGIVQFGFGLLLLALGVTGIGGLWGIGVPLFFFLACNGFILPNASALAMAPHGKVAGLASGLLGTLQFGVAAISSALVGALENGTAMPMVGVIAGWSCVALCLNAVMSLTTRKTV